VRNDRVKVEWAEREEELSIICKKVVVKENGRDHSDQSTKRSSIHDKEQRANKVVCILKKEKNFQCWVYEPFDVIGGLGNEEALRVAINFDVRPRVNGDGTCTVFLRADFKGDQQQFQFDETHPTSSICHSLHQHMVYCISRHF